MCPFCIGTALWIAAGAVAAGGVSAVAMTKLAKNKHAQEGARSNDDE